MKEKQTRSRKVVKDGTRFWQRWRLLAPSGAVAIKGMADVYCQGTSASLHRLPAFVLLLLTGA